MNVHKARIATTTPFLGSFLEKRLGAEGFEVEKAASSGALLEIGIEQKPEIVLVQMDIPGMGGLEICRRLKGAEDTRRIPVILMSRDAADREPSFKAGANAFLKIPFAESELMEALSRLLQKKKCILMVDDSKVIHKRTGTFLTQHDYIVLDAYDGVEGIEIAKRDKPDLIISDIEMPRMDGYTMCKELKRCDETAFTPVIIVSSLGKGFDIDKGFEAGANDYLIKPVVHEELLSCVDSLLRTMDIRRQETVLVVDDSKTVVNMLKFGLMQQGFQVIACTDGEEAYEKTVEMLPDIILADLDMPKLNGYQLVKYLKERKETRNIPVVIISSRESRAEATRGLRIGAAAFVSKPFTMDKVLSNVERLTAERRLLREREAMKLYMSEAALEAATKTSQEKTLSTEFHAAEKDLTILFSDIVGFTTMCEKSKPQEIVTLLNNYLDIMTTVLKSHGAIIDKFIGDAILVIFGPSSSSENPQLRAVKAALEMLDRQAEFNAASSGKIQTRIGINSGKVIFGDIGSRFYRRDFTVIGDTVNTAQRLQVMAEPDSVFISDSVFKAVEGKIEAEEISLLSLKGKKEKIKTYRVLELLAPKL
jgi:DNA-binding response OmpR family regulator